MVELLILWTLGLISLYIYFIDKSLNKELCNLREKIDNQDYQIDRLIFSIENSNTVLSQDIKNTLKDINIDVKKEVEKQVAKLAFTPLEINRRI